MIHTFRTCTCVHGFKHVHFTCMDSHMYILHAWIHTYKTPGLSTHGADEDDEEEFSSKFKLPEFGKRKNPAARPPSRPPPAKEPLYLNSPDMPMVAGVHDTSMFIPST